MGFREEALSAAAAQHERELCEQEAKQESLRREATTKLHKPALKALKDWSKRTRVSTAKLTVEPVPLPGYHTQMYQLLFTWSSDGCEFSASYGPPSGTSTPPILQVMMQDPSRPNSNEWYDANTQVQIGEILSGAAKEERERKSDANNWG